MTTSNITVMVEPNRRSMVVVCHGINTQLTENVVASHTINVLCEYIPLLLLSFHFLFRVFQYWFCGSFVSFLFLSKKPGGTDFVENLYGERGISVAAGKKLDFCDFIDIFTKSVKS